MEILAALVGAIFGAVASFVLSEYFRRRDERERALAAVHAEIELNIELAEEILCANSEIDFDAEDDSKWTWCEIIPFSDSAWTAIVSGGGLSQLQTHLTKPVSRSYTMVRRANYVAAKIRSGRYHPREGKHYNLRVLSAKESLSEALSALDAKPRRRLKGG